MQKGKNMLVKTLLEAKKREIITVSPSTLIDDAMDLLISNKIGCLPVIEENGRLLGILSDKDIFKKLYETKGDYHSLKVEDVMTTALVVGLPDDDISYIAGVMDKNWIRHVPIVEGEKLIGLVSQRDILKTQAQKTEIENRYLSMYMEGMDSRDLSADL